jgi:hypothetical protein
MSDRSRPQYFLDGGNAASPTQARIDDHQVRPVAGRGNHRVAFGGRCRANVVAHACEQFREQHGDQGVILDDEHAKHFHQLIDAHGRGLNTTTVFAKQWGRANRPRYLPGAAQLL